MLTMLSICSASDISSGSASLISEYDGELSNRLAIQGMSFTENVTDWSYMEKAAAERGFSLDEKPELQEDLWQEAKRHLDA